SAPEPEQGTEPQGHAAMLPVLISAASPSALKAAIADFAADLAARPVHGLYDIAYQAFHRREALPHRAVVWGNTPATMARALAAHARGEDAPTVQSGAVVDE